MKFYVCKYCGNPMANVEDAGVSVVRCGGKTTEFVPNTTAAAIGKHVPVITINGNAVAVNTGSVEHPMNTSNKSNPNTALSKENRYT
ncbi:MAG: hypothetical protein RR893_03355 [Clostridia bacterium]